MRRIVTLSLSWALLLGSASTEAESLRRPKLDWEYSTGTSLAQSVVVDTLARPYLYAAIKEVQQPQKAWGVGLTDDTIYLTYIRAIVPFQGTWSGIRSLKRRRN